MKSVLLAGLFLASFARAEVIDCPARYPEKDIVLPGGNGKVQPARLSFAYMQMGSLHDEQRLQGPEGKKVKGGRDTAYDFKSTDSKWLVCIYGGTEWSGLDRISPGSIQWWGKVTPRATACVLRVRETRLRASLSDWTASATCKPDGVR